MDIIKTREYLIDPLLESRDYKDIISNIKRGGLQTAINGPSESQKAHICYAICNHLNSKGILVAYNELQARKIYEDLSYFFDKDVILFSSKEIMLHDVEAKSYEAVYERIAALGRILKHDYKFIVISAEAIVQKLISKELFEESCLIFDYSNRIDLTITIQKLISIGYERVTTVEGKGQFAIRGGIIDIYPINSENAYRIELFDDEIDSIRIFDVISQRSIEKTESVEILPAREIIYDRAQLDSIISEIQKDLVMQKEKVNTLTKQDYIVKLDDKISHDLDKFKEDYYFPGMDKYISYIIKKPQLIMDYIDENIVVFFDEPKRFQQRVENIHLENTEICKALLEKGHLLPGCFNIYFEFDYIWSSLYKKKSIYFNTIMVDELLLSGSKKFTIASRLLNSYQGNFDLMVDDVKYYKESSFRVLILAGTKSKGEMLAETLRSKEIETVYIDEVREGILPGQVIVTHGSLNKGFEYPEMRFVVISGKELFGQDRKLKRHIANKNKGKKISVFTDLNIGDFVVHQSHGIGRYTGIEQLVVDNIKKDYLKIQYQEGAFLYVPTNQLDLIQKYIGSEGKTPKLSKLGGADWLKTKAKTKQSLMELAGELIKLYAMRESLKGYAFGKDTVWQKQFEEQFPYQETEDQLKCIEEIKQDMESDKPMDRLLCGDVGYGKTEVAIRAIFKAVMEGKQVAYLVPTTVLAQQQYSNFKERMKDFPVTVEMVSRFRTPTEQKNILKDAKAGLIDVLIGTHRLLQKDVAFKNLGLLVIDEEQRFGVMHKEKIKNMRANVDVLTLTATPIPRTLHMSMVGIKDISTLEDPPEERYPVQTYVMEHNTEVIKEAINREMSRSGQVFYLYNRVRSINVKAAEIKNLVPDARIAVAHGQMKESELEDVMFRFINGEYDVLVCTVIIESGLDMPNVNTIIVEDSDKMGLAQLYQLRGRVGRSNRMAYAYITYKKDKVLSEIAEKRLQAIKEFTEFGSGFKIAMRDLQIRGAGNLLGAQQHGHIDSVGYDMYCKLLEEALGELRGQSRHDDVEISIDVNLSAYIDNSYISMENEKIEMYKRIASIQDEQDVLDVEDELIDRFGDIPIPVSNLIKIAHVKALALKCGFSSVQEKNDAVIFQFIDGMRANFEVIGKLMEKYKRKLLFTASNNPYITYRTNDIKRENFLDNIKILLQDIIDLK
ncbi:MAG: transcription-repair coupling factor [Clostridiaceae bacterium]|nr:transcription-repair coupling factor [Clostridiaceae bacterium]